MTATALVTWANKNLTGNCYTSINNQYIVKLTFILMSEGIVQPYNKNITDLGLNGCSLTTEWNSCFHLTVPIFTYNNESLYCCLLFSLGGWERTEAVRGRETEGGYCSGYSQRSSHSSLWWGYFLSWFHHWTCK